MATILRLPVVTLAGGVDQNDVAVAVPVDKEWLVESVWAELTSTATVGNREIRVQVRDGSANVLYEVVAPAVQAASLTVNYVAGAGLPREAQVADDLQSLPLPRLLLAATHDVRVFDATGVDALDDLTVRVLARERNV